MKKVLLAVLLMSSASAFAVSSESRLLGVWGGLGSELEYSIDGTLTFKYELETKSASCRERPVELADLKGPASKGAEVILDCRNADGNKSSYFVSYYTSYNNEACLRLADTQESAFIIQHLFCKK